MSKRQFTPTSPVYPVLLLPNLDAPIDRSYRKISYLPRQFLYFRDIPRTYTPAALPVIEPINDDYLISFGRSYTDAKNMAESQGGQNAEGASSSSSSSDDNDSDDDDNGLDSGAQESSASGGGAAADGGLGSPSKVGGGGAAESTPRSSLSGGRKKHGVFLANLPYVLCDEFKLEEIFGVFGRITSVVVLKSSGASPGERT